MNLFSYSSGGQESEPHLIELNSRCQQGWLLLDTAGENLFLCLTQLLVAANIPGLVAASLQCLLP